MMTVFELNSNPKLHIKIGFVSKIQGVEENIVFFYYYFRHFYRKIWFCVFINDDQTITNIFQQQAKCT